MNGLDRRELLVLAPLALALAGCSQTPIEPAPEAQSPPSGTVFVLRPDVAAARDRGEAPPGATDAELVRRTGDALLARLRETPSGEGARLVLRGGWLELALPRRLPAEDAAEIASALPVRGRLGIWIACATDDGLDLEAERGRLAAWLASAPDAPLDRFNRLPRERGGPVPGLRWCELPASEDEEARIDRCVPLRVPAEASERFGGADFAEVYPSQDPQGYPAIGFELKSGRKADFGAFTEANVDRDLAIEIDDECVMVANINSRLPGGGIIMGRFSNEEIQRRIAELRGGELPVPVELVEIR